MKQNICLAGVFICLFFLNSFALEKQQVVIASGETHAMLTACDCPTEPGGGFAKRATLIAKQRDSNDVVLVDVGGFAGGGVYDPYTEGRHNDSLRTLASLRAMGYLQYDAACIGDDDLVYGGLWLAKQAFYAKVPLVSVNAYYSNGKPLANPYILVKKGAVTYGITGITTQDNLFAFPDSVLIKPPLPALHAIWNDLRAKSDVQIILSHAGEEMSRALLDSFPGCALVVNGHRKNTMGEFVAERGNVMLQFGFQGKSLSTASVVRDSKGFTVGKTSWLTVGPAVPEDPEVAKLVSIQAINTSLAQQVYDLYIMSHCPYGCSALREFTAFVKRFPQVQWNVWFIGTTFVDSSVSSLHGKSEVEDELLWLAVSALYPKQWLAFLTQRANEKNTPTEKTVRDLGMDLKKLREWVAKNGLGELRRQYTRSMRMGVNASPTLLINNVAYDGGISTFRLSKSECLRNAHKQVYCDSLPECEADGDCMKPGKVGKCVSLKGKKAVCAYSDASKFTLTVVRADSAINHPEYGVIGSILERFPGATIDTLYASSKGGSDLIKKYSPPFLPFFLFDTAMKKTTDFSSISEDLIDNGAGLVFRPGMVKPSYFYKRVLTPNKMAVYMDPLFPASTDAIRMCIDKKSPAVTILPLVFVHPDSTGASAEDKMRAEEALRWLVLQKAYPDKFRAYLEQFVKRKNLSYWFTDCSAIGINVDAFVKKVQTEAAVLAAHYKEIDELGMKDPVEVLMNNREVIATKNPKQLMELLGMVK